VLQPHSLLSCYILRILFILARCFPLSIECRPRYWLKSFATSAFSYHPRAIFPSDAVQTQFYSTMIVPDNSATANTGMDKLMTFAEFEAFVAANEWISNEEFDSESYPNHPWFRVKTMEVQHYLDGASTKILKAIGTAPKDDVELRHLERNAFEVRHVQHGHARKIFFMGIAGNVSLVAIRNVH
jgi:protein involved in sex pheromone biosynthesis